MNQTQWDLLLDVIKGKEVSPLPTGFIIDSPWLPGWYGVSTLDYFTSEKIWFDANKKAIETFPESIFLPGFWSEFGMCTEPSAFGSKCRWDEVTLPHPEKISSDINVLCQMNKPDVKKDGLLPFVINRLKLSQKQIEAFGHQIKFAVARGPLNIASFLYGTTELMMAMMTEQEKCHKLVELITDFLIDWIEYQMQCFPTIEGILLLDDIIGFIGDQQCKEYVVPYFKKIYGSFDAKVNFLHNDAKGLVCAPYLLEMGVNLFNFSFEHSIAEMKKLTSGKVTLLGNIPPRDVLEQGTPKDVEDALIKSVENLKETTRIILSCGGGVPQGVTTENINSFIATAKKL
jgi:uroporphyrinogen-III decarboxylase